MRSDHLKNYKNEKESWSNRLPESFMKLKDHIIKSYESNRPRNQLLEAIFAGFLLFLVIVSVFTITILNLWKNYFYQYP